MFGINYLGIVVAAVATYLLGWLWHGPLFGKKWMKLEGFEMPAAMTPEVKKQMMKSMFFGFLVQLILAWGVAYFVSVLASDLWSAFGVALTIWFAFVATTLAGGWLWERKPGKLVLFNMIFPLVSALIMALIIWLW